MELDRIYEDLHFQLSEMPHSYGANIHLLSNPALMTLLARFCSPEVVQPEANRLVRMLFEHLLLEALNKYGPQSVRSTATRMTSAHPGAKFHGKLIDRATRFAVTDLMRAGIYPSHVCYDMLHDFLPGEQIRQDHVVAARLTDAQKHVVGVDISGSKIGGSIKGHILVVPDPMAATGTTVTQILKKYNESFEGPPKDIWLLHLIVTPEYLSRIAKEVPAAKVFAVRCDRGLSTPEVFRSKFGALKDKEKGLNDHQYIVPGGGGIGEILNNSFV